ncbi:zinc finger BED domain-containing protein RICESLEEPER 2-like [Papaver somniferum]|uniref:zinc finger BED domain-containing protein RICESLEEPER 2-like n=1 Tax=Papaver somniferum TaxID=3469 RepID=UPI000E6FC5FB|nr:zinc finger BED domain-containing protein RICESLEEPER 2-like [Papaver somniferum]
MSVEEDHDDVMSEEDITVVESMTSQEHASKKRKFTSKVWNDFDWSRYKDGKEKATCKHCRKEYAYDNQKGGTSTMSRHLKKFPRLKMQDVGQLLLSTNNGELATRARKIDQSKFRDLVARLIIDGLTEIDPAVIKIRLAVKYLKGSQRRKQNFLDTVSYLGMSVKMGVRQDVKTRWNSTYLMLQSCISYEKVFTHLRLVDSDYAESPNGEEWDQIKVVTKFLKVFYDLTTLFSGNKYPTSNFYFDGVCQIKVLLDQETTNDIEFIRNMAKKMQEKFAKYWKKLSPILAMAVVLDPRLKFEFVEFTLEKVYPVEREMKKEVDIIRKRMAALYKEYHTASTLRGSTTTNETQNSGIVNGGNSGRNGSAFMQVIFL